MDRVNKVTTHDGVSLRLVYEVMWHMISGAIQAGGVVGKLGGTGGLHPSAIGPTADVLWFVGLELEYEGATESSSPLSPSLLSQLSPPRRQVSRQDLAQWMVETPSVVGWW